MAHSSHHIDSRAGWLSQDSGLSEGPGDLDSRVVRPSPETGAVLALESFKVGNRLGCHQQHQEATSFRMKSEQSQPENTISLGQCAP